MGSDTESLLTPPAPPSGFTFRRRNKNASLLPVWLRWVFVVTIIGNIVSVFVFKTRDLDLLLCSIALTMAFISEGCRSMQSTRFTILGSMIFIVICGGLNLLNTAALITSEACQDSLFANPDCATAFFWNGVVETALYIAILIGLSSHVNKLPNSK